VPRFRGEIRRLAKVTLHRTDGSVDCAIADLFVLAQLGRYGRAQPNDFRFLICVNSGQLRSARISRGLK
jgi:hypothetical protein